ncbi:MAG: Type 1 glutamine amidotransferase-like domain-containing protein [Clostridiales bacterium]|nr:Type 1 glutamine amidotransferase-like domain-containing protein [Clostridiales bacterium]
MILFLTSSPTGPLDGSRQVSGLDPMNGFPERLRAAVPEGSVALIVTAFPDDSVVNDEMRAFFENALRQSGIPISCLDLWDRRSSMLSREDIARYGLILLGGGHVPTQNRFFAEISLREKLAGFNGVVLGISAGSMNAAETVYVQPEEPGESLDPFFPRSLPGLALTKAQILPHYQMVKNRLLDGRRLFEDITYGDSYGRTFLVLCDGSYLLAENGRETVFGEAYRIAEGICAPFCRDAECREWIARQEQQ